MVSNNSPAAEIRPLSRHGAVSGYDVPLNDIDGVFAANRKPALVHRLDVSAREILSVEPESAREADRPPSSFWSVVFADLMEGFALSAVSLHPEAFPIELFQADHDISQPHEVSPPRGPRAVVPSSTNPGKVAAAQLEQTSGDAGAASVDAGFFESSVTSVGVVRRSARWLRNLIVKSAEIRSCET